MAWEALSQVCSRLQQRQDWLGGQQLSRILHAWPEVVGPVVAPVARPVSLQRGVLQVAVSSSVWAQTLAFERTRILAKLNPRLQEPVTDLQFSVARWHRPVTGVRAPKAPPARPSASSQIQQQLLKAHPSQWLTLASGTGPAQVDSESAAAVVDPAVAFQRWARLVQERSRDWPLCPGCDSPAPPGELARWSVCSVCLARQRPR